MGIESCLSHCRKIAFVFSYFPSTVDASTPDPISLTHLRPPSPQLVFHLAVAGFSELESSDHPPHASDYISAPVAPNTATLAVFGNPTADVALPHPLEFSARCSKATRSFSQSCRSPNQYFVRSFNSSLRMFTAPSFQAEFRAMRRTRGITRG